MTLRVAAAGVSAVLVELDDVEQVRRLHAALRQAPLPGTVDVVPAARTVLVILDRAVTSTDRMTAELREYRVPAAAGVLSRPGPVVEVPVRYDGPDLATVARLTGLSEGGLVGRHQRPEYVVAFCGFAPGFAYLTGGDPALRVPRRATPRTEVPAGSIGLADAFTGTYPRQMPGGWQLIGRTDAVLWQLDRDPPALLPPGTPVRFVAVDT